MSKESRQRLREAKQRPHKKKFRWIIPVAILIFIVSGIFVWIYFHPKHKEIIATAVLDPSQPRTLKELLTLSPAELEKCDVGLGSCSRRTLFLF
jgi:hypothetical protein